jgi:PAS domain S-box-containing protein
MTAGETKAQQVEALIATPDLAGALESEQFRHFLDQVPIAIVVSEMRGRELIAYANPEFERLSGQSAAEVAGQPWSALHGRGEDGSQHNELGAALVESKDCVGTFQIERRGREPALVDAYSNIIQDDDGVPAFRLAALVEVGAHRQGTREELEQRIREKDAQLLEIQHRVKNNLQMITALIRIETRNAQDRIDAAPFHRLAGRIESIQLLYKLLSAHGEGDQIDLGVYLSEIASSVMHSHAVEGIRLELKVDAYPVSVNVAMPTGLVVNELLTNALKYAFAGREGGTITLQSLVDEKGCSVLIADDGNGLPEGVQWPKRGKLGALIVRSLRENAKADLKVESIPGKGMRVTIVFTRAASAPGVKS